MAEERFAEPLFHTLRKQLDWTDTNVHAGNSTVQIKSTVVNDSFSEWMDEVAENIKLWNLYNILTIGICALFTFV